MVKRFCRISNLATVRTGDGAVISGVVPLSTATIWRWIKAGKFPKPFKLGGNTTVFDLDEVETWLKNKTTREL
jgi:prophage regulatory protein